jgi:hypothetical protein
MEAHLQILCSKAKLWHYCKNMFPERFFMTRANRFKTSNNYMLEVQLKEWFGTENMRSQLLSAVCTIISCALDKIGTF